MEIKKWPLSCGWRLAWHASVCLSGVMNCDESDLLLSCERNPHAKAIFFWEESLQFGPFLSNPIQSNPLLSSPLLSSDLYLFPFIHMGWWVLCLFIFFSQICYDVIIKVYKFCGRWIWIYDRHGWCQIVGFGSEKWNWLKMRVVCSEVWKKDQCDLPDMLWYQNS